MPPSAPNLNLTERFWHFMERKALFNKAGEKSALFKQAFVEFFDVLETYAGALMSLITDRFHFIGKPRTGLPPA